MVVSQYLYSTNTEENNQKLNEPRRHQFIKHKQEARSNKNKKDCSFCIHIYNSTNTLLFNVWDILWSIL
jgi:hypothetical protein